MKKQLSFLMLLAALIVPWVTQAQTLENYGFTTGVDSSKWVSMTGATQILTPSGSDGLASSVQNIGFSFPFAGTNYTQYSVNTDGNLRLGSTATGTGSYSTPFSSSYSNQNNPKINAFGCDGYGNSGSHYVKAKLHETTDGDTLLAVEFCMGTYTTTTRNELYKWQIHLYANGNIDIVFPSTLPTTAPAVAHQCGMCVSATDGWIISASTNTAQHFTNGTSVTNASGTWFDVNRYYSFIHPSNISCPAPTGITASNVTSDGATISWTAGGTESAWELTVGDDTYYPTDTFYTLTNLDGNTPYVASVRAICGAGDTSFASSTSFRTACVAISQMPYINDFENDPYYSLVPYAEAIPNCWHRINDASGTYNYYPYLTTTASYVHSGSVGMYWYHSTTTTYANNEYAVLPPVDLNAYNISDLTLAFYAKTTSTSYHPQPIVGVMTNPSDASTFTPIYTFTATEITTEWQLFAVSLASYTGSGAYIAIKWPRPSSICYLGIDDIYLTDDWCDIPMNVTASSTTDEVTVSWSANGGSSFTVVLGTDTITNVSDTTYTFTALNSNTEYTYSVSTECSGGNSMFIGGSIRTLCSMLDSLPYSYGFEDLPTGSSSVRPVIPCWHHLNNATTYFGYPYVSSTTPHSGTRNLYWYGSTTSGTYGDYQIVVLPGVDTNLYPINTLQLTFWARPSSTSYSPVFQVGVMTDPNDVSTFHQVATVNVQNTTNWQEFTTLFDTYTGYGNFVAVRMNRPSSSYYAYTDDFTLRVIPTCFWPTDVTAESVSSDGATISWTPDSRSTATSWSVEYGPHGFTRGEGTTDNVSDTTLTLTGLTPSTEYDIYVAADCGGDVSESVLYTFRTLCVALDSLPLTENFDSIAGSTATSGVANNLPMCWNYYNDGTRTNYQGCPYVYSSTTYAHSGTNCIRFYSYAGSGDSNQYLILPLVDSTLYPVNTLRVGFWLRAYSTSSTYHADVVVGVMTNPTDESTFVPVHTVTSSSTSYAHYEVNLGQYTGAHGCVALKFPVPTASSNYEYGYVDDVTLEPAPTCAPVVSHNVVTTAAAARITWEADPTFANTPNSYEVSYGYASDNLVGATTTVVTDQQLLLTGLTPDTTYTVSILPICTDGTAQAHVFNFSTQALPCLEWDTTSTGGHSSPAATYVVGTPGTSTTNVMPVNGAYNYSYCNHLILRTDISTVPAGTTYFSGIDFQYAGTSPMTSKTNCAIYMCHTTMTTCDNFANPADLVLVYEGPLNCTTPNAWNHFEFNRATFAYDGTSNIIVAIVDNSGAHNTAETFYYENIGTSRSHRVYRDDAPYTFADLGTVTAGNSVWRSNMHLTTGGNGGGSCLTLASCAAPAVSVEEDSTGNLEISWIPGYQETSWDVDYQAEGDSAWTNLVSGTSLTSYTVLMSSLQSNTHYTFRVTALCSDTNVAGTATFTTPCSYISIPYTYGFEDLPTGSSTAHTTIPCWHHINNATTYFGYPYASSTTPHGGIRSLYWYASITAGSYADYQVVVLPPVDTVTNPVNTLQLSFWARPTSTSYVPVFYVGVMTDPDDVTTFQYVDTINVDHTTTNWEYYESTLRNYTGTGKYVAIRANRPTSTWYAYMDDVALENAPDCPRVENVTVTNFSQTSVTVNWDTTSASDYEVQYGPAGFVLGSGTIVPVSNNDSLDITGLTSNTPYDVYVRGICTSDTGNWSFVNTFRTECSMITSLPFTEDFESQATGSSSTTSPFIPCWTRLNNGTTYGGYPYVSGTSTYNHTAGGTKGLYWYGSTTANTYGDYQYIILPHIDTDSLPINTTQLSFWAKASSTSYNPVFEVGVMNNPTDTAFQSLGTININGNTTWTKYVTGLGNYTGNGSYIAIRALRPSSSWYAYVDDITLELLPTCPRVENIVAMPLLTSATVSWTDTSSNASWYVEYDTVTFTPGTGHMTPILVTDTFCVLTGLDSATLYHVYVYPECGTDVFYTYATFTTLAASPATVPYSCGFEAAGTNGWDLLNGAQGNYWMVGSATNNGGNQSLYITDNGTANNYSGSASYVFATRTFDLAAGGYVCSYDWKCQGESSFDFLRVALVPAGTTLTPGDYSGFDNASAVPAGGIALDGSARLNLQSTWQTQIEEFAITTPGTYTLVFMWRNDGSVYNQTPGAIDNVTLIANTCPIVENVRVVSAGTTSLTIDWTDVATGTPEWQVRYGLNGSTTTTTLTVNSHPVTINGLDSLTAYAFSVRPICSATDTGSWCPTALLSTEFCDNATVAATGSTTGTAYLTPVNNYFHYTLTETIIDSAELAGIGEISSIAYNYAYSAAMTDKTDVTIWLQPTTKTVFSSTSDIVALDTTTAVQVYHGDLNCSQGWNYFPFDTTYFWDGHSNLLVIVDDNSDAYNSSSYTFNISNCNGYKTITYYSDSYNPDPLSPSSFSGTKTYYQYRATMKLVSCNNSACPTPVITSAAVTDQTVTINYTGTATDYEVAIMAGNWVEPSAGTPVSANSYTFTGLTYSTTYTVGVRAVCDVDLYSQWYTRSVTTEDHPCDVPTGIAASNLGYTSATLTWNAAADQTQFEVLVTGTNYDTSCAVTGTTLTLDDLTSDVEYTVKVIANCGPQNYSDTSAAYTFRTNKCNVVTGLAATNVTATTATLTWNAASGNAVRYEVEYGEAGFREGNGTTVQANGTTVTLTDLLDDFEYDAYVRVYCTETLYSNWSEKVTFTTTTEGIDEAAAARIGLYPNPASSTVTLTGIDGEATVTVVDMNGREVQTVKHTGSSDITLDVTGMAQGAYFVRITGERVSAIRKLIVR